jgi:hypothetical protein
MSHVLTPTGALLTIEAARDLYALPAAGDPTAAGLVRLGRTDGRLTVRWRAGRLTPAQRDRLSAELAKEVDLVGLAVLSGGWLEETAADGAAALLRLDTLAGLPAQAAKYRQRSVHAAASEPIATAVAWLRGGRGRADDDTIRDFFRLGLARRAIAIRLPPRRERGTLALDQGLVTHVGEAVRAAGDAWRAGARGRPLPHSYPDRDYLRRAWADTPAVLATGVPALSHADVVVAGRRAPRRLRLERMACALETGDGGRLVLTLTALCPGACSVPLVG